jgi:hypothetical protein
LLGATKSSRAERFLAESPSLKNELPQRGKACASATAVQSFRFLPTRSRTSVSLLSRRLNRTMGFELLAQAHHYPPPQINGAFLAGFIGAIVFVYIFFAICIQRIAVKAGAESTWMAYVPILQLILLLYVADKPTWYIILFLIPFVGIIMNVLLWVWVAEALGRNQVIAGIAGLTGIGLLFLLPAYAFSD